MELKKKLGLLTPAQTSKKSLEYNSFFQLKAVIGGVWGI